MTAEPSRPPEESSLPTKTANVGRTAWGLFFVASSIVNLVVTLPNPGFYEVFADLTFIPFYRWLLLNIALPNAYLISALVVIYEFTVGLLTLGRGKAVKWGLIGTGLWLLFVCPSMGWYTVFSPILLVIPGWMLRYDYPANSLACVFGKGE